MVWRKQIQKGSSDEGLDIDKFFIMDEVLDVISAFKGVEGRLVGSWDIYIKALEQYKAREGDCLVPWKHIEVLEDGTRVSLGDWIKSVRDMRRKGFLITTEKINQLTELEFVWNEKDLVFQNHINECIQFLKKTAENQAAIVMIQ